MAPLHWTCWQREGRGQWLKLEPDTSWDFATDETVSIFHDPDFIDYYHGGACVLCGRRFLRRDQPTKYGGCSSECNLVLAERERRRGGSRAPRVDAEP